MQLEDPFGYDRADIKVDAIVEDLRVRTTLSSPTFATSSLANPQGQFSKSNAELIYQPIGGDERTDRRVEKGLRHVRRLDIPNATTMELADRLARTTECFDQLLLLSSSTKVFRPAKDETKLFAYKAPRLEGFTDRENSLLVCCRIICPSF